MTSYLYKEFDWQTSAIADSYDDLPFWSAATGTLMLSLIKTAKHQKVLDIGFGTGFPLLILSQRFGPTCQLYGQDIWEKAMETTEMKIAARGISNVELLRGSASKIDLPDNSVDLVTSNLGINNFAEPEQVIKECRRVLKPGGELVLATNLEGTFQEFYESFDTTLLQMQMTETMGQLREHIRQRPSLEDVTEEFIKHGMNLELAVTDSMNMYYTDGSAFLNDYFIIMSFLPSWKALIHKSKQEEFFEKLEQGLNVLAEENDELRLTVPIAAFKFSK